MGGRDWLRPLRQDGTQWWVLSVLTICDAVSWKRRPGIEYGDMQLIAEAYDILKRGLGLHESEIATIFEKWNKGVLDSFLIEITTNILKFNDDDGEPLVTKILDQAGQKGTGKWTAIAALDAGTAGTNTSPSLFPTIV